MTQKPSAREAVLDAFERLVNDKGERAATVDAVAAEAGVSKGGLLYHFASKSELVDGLVARLTVLAAEDREQLRAAPEGIVRHFIRSSVVLGTPFDSTFIAAARLAQSGLYPAVNEALTSVETGWRVLVEHSVGDTAIARLVLLVSDGLYYNAALFALDESTPPVQELDDVIEAIEQLVALRSPQ
ncbi:MAG: TetR/AcrR family transcriptional regulator [Microbacteriaceae bacterium]